MYIHICIYIYVYIRICIYVYMYFPRMLIHIPRTAQDSPGRSKVILKERRYRVFNTLLPPSAVCVCLFVCTCVCARVYACERVKDAQHSPFSSSSFSSSSSCFLGGVSTPSLFFFLFLLRLLLLMFPTRAIKKARYPNDVRGRSRPLNVDEIVFSRHLCVVK